VVARTTARADELTPDEIVGGGRALRRKVRRYAPRYLAVLGLGAYRIAFGRKDSAVGPQPETIGATNVWLLPNPSGLNAHYQLPDLAREFGRLRRATIRMRAPARPKET
jgi:TDG/mug DNA glycosylase family protein